MEGFVEADFDGGEVVVAATEGEAGAGDGGVGGGEAGEDVVWRHRSLMVEVIEGGRDGDGAEGGAGGGEEGVGAEAGADAVGAPLVLEQAGVGVDVVEGGAVRGGGVGAILGIAAVVVLGPEAVEDEGGVVGALGSVGMAVAELGGPGEIEQVVVEAGGAGELGLELGGEARCCGGVGGVCGGLGGAGGLAGGEGERKGETEGQAGGKSAEVHGRRIAGGGEG